MHFMELPLHLNRPNKEQTLSLIQKMFLIHPMYEGRMVGFFFREGQDLIKTQDRHSTIVYI